ncbi:hypothetical protein BDV19DRAFT_365089 [Aspergillus venezuelensis]
MVLYMGIFTREICSFLLRARLIYCLRRSYGRRRRMRRVDRHYQPLYRDWMERSIRRLPSYLYVGQPLVSFTNYGQGFKIKLSDMGGEYFFDNPPPKIITPLGLRPPELILTGSINNTLDIWSSGYLILVLITVQPLFCIPGPDWPAI